MLKNSRLPQRSQLRPAYLAVNSSKLSSWCPVLRSSPPDLRTLEVLKLVDPEVAIMAGTA